jgi:hypothetical protein
MLRNVMKRPQFYLRTGVISLRRRISSPRGEMMAITAFPGKMKEASKNTLLRFG